jgi:hypothetical protein
VANVDDTVTAEWTWGGHRFSAHGVVTKVSGKTTKVRLTEHAGEHFAPGVVVTVSTENVRKKEETMARTPLHGRQAPRPRMNAGRHIAPGYPAERFRIGQDVAMISNPSMLGHIAGFDPDGSVTVQWSGGRTVTGVDPRNLRIQGIGYAGRRASEGRPLPRRPLRAREADEVEVWIDASDNEAPWLAQHWYSGQGDPLYALSSTGFPQPESTISWALSNAKKSENEQWAHIEKTYGKKGAQKLMAIDPESREARALPDEKREDLEATDEIGRLVWALQEALKQGERISAEEGLQRQGVAPGTRW